MKIIDLKLPMTGYGIHMTGTSKVFVKWHNAETTTITALDLINKTHKKRPRYMLNGS